MNQLNCNFLLTIKSLDFLYVDVKASQYKYLTYARKLGQQVSSTQKIKGKTIPYRTVFYKGFATTGFH